MPREPLNSARVRRSAERSSRVQYWRGASSACVRCMMRWDLLTSRTEGASSGIFARSPAGIVRGPGHNSPAEARCGALGVEDSGGQRGELVDLIGAEMREEPTLQSSDVVVLSLLELLDPLAGDRDFDTATVVAGRAPGDQSPRFEFGHESRHPALAERRPFD